MTRISAYPRRLPQTEGSLLVYQSLLLISKLASTTMDVAVGVETTTGLKNDGYMIPSPQRIRVVL